VTPSQCRAARWLLGMDREGLAKASDITVLVINDYENEGRLPRARGGETREERLAAIRAALEAAGGELTYNNVLEVRLRLQANPARDP
jgi:hypothetical protein